MMTANSQAIRHTRRIGYRARAFTVRSAYCFHYSGENIFGKTMEGAGIVRSIGTLRTPWRESELSPNRGESERRPP